MKEKLDNTTVDSTITTSAYMDAFNPSRVDSYNMYIRTFMLELDKRQQAMVKIDLTCTDASRVLVLVYVTTIACGVFTDL